MAEITVGTFAELEATVTKELTARHLGSGGVDVFSTPSMIALMEGAAVRAIDPLLPEGSASVGSVVNVRHLAATPLGHRVKARAEVTAVEGRQITFKVEAHDEKELVGEGTHVRFVIDIARFLKRIDAKAK